MKWSKHIISGEDEEEDNGGTNGTELQTLTSTTRPTTTTTASTTVTAPLLSTTTTTPSDRTNERTGETGQEAPPSYDDAIRNTNVVNDRADDPVSII